MLLPAATLWLWAACAAICGQEAATHSLAAAPSAELAEVGSAPQCEGCPFASFPKATAPDTRASTDVGPQTPPAVTPPTPAAGPGVCHYAFGQSRRAPPASAPPLELLSALRI